jgi:membrane-bound lytic murein transglycosylase A
VTRRRAALVLLCLAVAGCRAPFEAAKTPEQALVELRPDAFPTFADDLDLKDLDEAIGHSLTHFARLAVAEPGRLLRFGEERVPAAKVAASLTAFRALIATRPDAATLRTALQQGFRVFQATGASRDREVLFTGYYLPELHASAVKDASHPWPLFGPPADLVNVRAKDFPGLGEDVVGRVVNGVLKPYPTRAEISAGAVPEEAAIAWVDSAVDAFFLEVQGSGVLRFPDGSSEVVTFAGRNGRPYAAIGGDLARRGEIAREAVSMQTIRAWLEAHPADRAAVMNGNPSYVFFRLADAAMGSLGVPVTGGRTLATDFRVFPKGALCFVETTRPDASGAATTVTRFMLDQDTGGAIRTAGHVDFFWGAGDDAAETAGRMKQNGRLFYLLAR